MDTLVNGPLMDRVEEALRTMTAEGLERVVPQWDRSMPFLNLADNDYFELAARSEVKAAAIEAVERFGASSSSSPLVSGFGPAHRSFIERVKRWHGFGEGMVWNSGYAANSALLGCLPKKGDLILADRLIHRSLIEGALRSGARIVRYAHCDAGSLEKWLESGEARGRQVFVVTESVFSMDGDYPDLARMAELKRRFGFFWIVDEAHALGWYGEGGSGLVEAYGCAGDVDALVGTMGKALGSAGAYTLFHDERLVRFLVNRAPEFVYSTYLPPACAAAAEAAIDWLEAHADVRYRGQGQSRRFRNELRESGLEVPDGDSPIVPVALGTVENTMRTACRLREQGILVGAIRPPTVPRGGSRLRISLKATLRDSEIDRLVSILGAEAD